MPILGMRGPAVDVRRCAYAGFPRGRDRKTMVQRRPINRLVGSILIVLLWVGFGSCSSTSLYNLAAPAGDFNPALSGAPSPRTIQVGFVNNTPFRAIFTYGSYDQLDEDTIPIFGQLRLEAHTSSNQTAQACQSSYSTGGSELVRLIDTNRNNAAVNITDERALVDGVYFSGAPLGDPLAAEPTEGTAQGMVVLNGVDFSCRRTDIDDTTGSGLLMFTFEQDATAPGGFRIDYLFIAP